MKKIFSLAICAMFATLSFAQLLEGPVASTKKVADPATEKVAISAPAALAAPARVQQAVGDTIEVETKRYNLEYYGAPDYDWFIILRSLDDSLEFRFDIPNQPAAGLPMNVTYTLDSMLVDYSWGKHIVSDGYYSIIYTSVSLTATPNAIDPNVADYDVIVTTTKNITYHLTYIAVTPFVKKGEVAINFSCDSVGLIDLISTSGIFQIDGSMPDTAAYKYAAITFYANQLAGTYTPADSYGSSYNWVEMSDGSTVAPWSGYYISATVADNKAVAVLDAEDSIRYTITFPIGCPVYDSVFTSNANILAGTNSYLTDKINMGENQYNAYKIGKSSAGGDMKVALPKGATKLGFHALAWNNAANTMLHVGDKTYWLDGAGISGNSPYTYAGENAAGHYYEIEFEELAEADTITFSADARVVFYGVNVVAPYSGVYAFEAKADSYDLGFGTLVATDTDSKQAVDANTAYFGDENGYIMFTNRLKTGGKSGAKNTLTLNPTSKGTVKLYARTGSSSATDRNVLVKHGEDTVANHIILESEAVEHRVYVGHKNATIKVYPAVEFEVVAGENYEITYPIGSVNFYGISINYAEPEAYVDTVASYSVTELLANAPAVQTLIQVSGVVTKIETVSYSVQDKTAANIWVAATAGDSAEATTVEFYECLALGGEGFTGFSALNDTVWMGEEYIAVGDTVKADGFYAPYKSQVEIAKNTAKTWYPEILSVKHYVAPEPEELKLYIIGDFQGWQPAAGVEMEAVSDSVFTYNYVYENEAYFAFTTVQNADWAVINQHRFAPATNGTVAAEGDNDLYANVDASFKIAAGDYTFTVDLSTMKLNVVNNATALHNTTAGVKAVKTIENGQIVIIRDGKKFNAVGAKL